MGLLSLGGSKSKSLGTSESFGISGSQANSYSTQQGLSQSQTGGQSTSRTGLAFADLFGQLYGGAAATAGGLTGEGVGSQAQMLFSGGTGFLDALQGGGAGADFARERLGSESPHLAEQISGLGEDLGRFFRNELNPAITSEAVGGGALGGGRQGVAQGQAMQSVGREFQRGATDLRAADLAQRDSLAQGLMQQNTAGAGVGLSSLPSLLGIGEAGEFASLAPYRALAGILGGPTVLSEAQSTQFGESLSTSEAIAQAISSSFGLDTSKSKTKSKSGSFNLGFG